MSQSYRTTWKIYMFHSVIINDSVQGGIALKKQTSGLTEKSQSVYQTNCEMAEIGRASCRERV